MVKVKHHTFELCFECCCVSDMYIMRKAATRGWTREIDTTQYEFLVMQMNRMCICSRYLQR